MGISSSTPTCRTTDVEKEEAPSVWLGPGCLCGSGAAFWSGQHRRLRGGFPVLLRPVPHRAPAARASNSQGWEACADRQASCQGARAALRDTAVPGGHGASLGPCLGWPWTHSPSLRAQQSRPTPPLLQIPYGNLYKATVSGVRKVIMAFTA